MLFRYLAKLPMASGTDQPKGDGLGVTLPQYLCPLLPLPLREGIGRAAGIGTQIHQNAATILPFALSNMNLHDTRGIGHMLAGMVLLSAVVGMVSVAAAAVLSMPTWVVFALYPVVCSLTLLLTAALFTIRSARTAQVKSTLHPQV